MSKNYNSSVFKDMLDKLQQESWQLELLISGFAIFGLFSATETIGVNYDIAQNDQRLQEGLLWFAAKVSCWILIINLLIHVVLRGLWIGALGLRYLSGDIDYEVLNYTPKFTNYLKKKIGSFDKYIATLEDYSSVVFAISFLLIFYFLASFAFLITILIIVFVFLENNYTGFWEDAFTVTGIILILLTLFGALLTFIDFITQGFLKKKKWLAFFYFPIYRVLSYVTLAFLYRPLVYNFLDNKFGKRLNWILLPVYLGLTYGLTYYYNYSHFINKETWSSGNFASYKNYDDLIVRKNDFIKIASIPSKVITDPYLRVFMILDNNLEDRITDFYKDLEPDIDTRGYITDIQFTNNYNRNAINKKNKQRREFFEKFNEFYHVYINKKKQKTDFVGTYNKDRRLGYETYVDIDTLTRGKHLLQITRKKINREKDTVNNILITIPFWKY